MEDRIVTIEEAAEKWVNTFYAFPTHMIKTLIDASYAGVYSDEDDWENVTPPVVGEDVFVGDEDNFANFADGLIEPNGEIVEYDEESDVYTIKLNDGKIVKLNEEEFGRLYVECYHLIPMWGTMWQFGKGDEDWMESGGLRKMAECGFTIIHSREFGYFFGIDGAGYNFYEHHWIPLYKARGLHWHTEKENDSEEKTE